MICPKCGADIKWYDLKPNCKNCGVNLTYYTQEKELTIDAKRAELEFAKGRFFVAKLKAAYIGGNLQIIRIVLSLLCVGALVLPFVSVAFNAPLITTNVSVGGLGVYSLISNGLLLVLPDLVSIELFSGTTVRLLAVFAAFILLALTAVAILLAELLAFTNINKTAKQMCVFSAIGAALSLVTLILSFVLTGFAGDLTYMEASLGLGGFAALAVNIAMLVLNKLIIKKDIQVIISENDKLRIETLKKIKAGEINFDDLPLPIFETPEEKEARLKSYAEAVAAENGGESA